MFANNNLALSTEILYLSQTRFVDGLGAKNDSVKPISKHTGLEKIAQSNDVLNPRAVNTSDLENNIQVLTETTQSAMNGLNELDQSYAGATKNLRIYINSEEGSAQKDQAKKEILDTKESISEILIELKEIENTQDLTELDSLIHNIVSRAIKDANSTFDELNLEEPDQALKGYYKFQMDRNNLSGRLDQLDSIESMLRESGAGVHEMNISNRTKLPNHGYNKSLVSSDFFENNINNSNLMLNFLNLNQRNSGRLFNYYL